MAERVGRRLGAICGGATPTTDGALRPLLDLGRRGDDVPSAAPAVPAAPAGRHACREQALDLAEGSLSSEAMGLRAARGLRGLTGVPGTDVL